MAKTDLAILKYWQASLADSVIGNACLNSKVINDCYPLSSEEAESGLLSQKGIDFLFKKEARQESKRDSKNIQNVEVSFRPLHVRRRSYHTRVRSDDLPTDVTPIITMAKVTPEGRIIPGRSVVARDILEPLARGTFSIGSVEDLDTFLTAHPFAVNEDQPDLWQRYQDYWRKLIAEVCANRPASDPEYQVSGHGLIQPAPIEAVRQILALSDTLIHAKPDTPLLANFARRTRRKIEPVRQAPFPLAERLGHSSDTYPVADHQREVLAHLADSQDGDILAVNGPPGTGKTTMLLSAIAGEWVRAALTQSDPPLIVAASTNNQAVTNIIDAFGKDFAQGTGPFAGRWLPDIKSFGLYLASLSKEKDVFGKYQLESFFDERETAEYLDRARASYLSAARKAFPDVALETVGSVVDALHRRLQEESRVLSRIDAVHSKCRAAEDAVLQCLGEGPETALAGRRKISQHFNARKAETAALQRKWERWLADEPILFSLFGFVPPVARKRILRARLFLRDAGAPEALLSPGHIAAIDVGLKEHSRRIALRADQEAKACDNAARLLSERAVRQKEWFTLASAFVPNVREDPSLHEIDRAVDVTLRFRLFQLATHYWEGRWILAVEEALPDIQRMQQTGIGKKNRDVLESKWSRRMMLTPCAVSTFASLPIKMTYWGKSSSKWEYMFNHIDLLIVDEAGQVLPEVAGPSFSLAKRALVIGDIQQIEPISVLPAPVDAGNLSKEGLLPHGGDQEALQALNDIGLVSRTGSAMRLAQSACRFHPYPELDRGLYLFEHRRCLDEIIGFCNELCYKGMLQPMRGSEVTPLPPMGYLHVDGMAETEGGSRYNQLEAKTIAAWLKANAGRLTAHYGQRLDEIVGIVTPFNRQATKIRQECAEIGIDAGITIGTVHALQGAERRVVIFSPVYSKHADGSFIDQSPSMLNVAVSRAKDSFLVFGDMDTLASAPPGSPRSLLAHFVSRDAANELDFEVSARPDLLQKQQGVELLRDAAEHDPFLLKELAGAKRRLCVASPWINAATMEQAGFITAIASARARGVEVEIFADPILTRQLNKDGRDMFAEACEALAGAGVPVHAVERLHSKLVWADDDLLVVGSFNWFSAHRSGGFARHETSVAYRGSHLGAEIQTLEGSLKARIAR